MRSVLRLAAFALVAGGLTWNAIAQSPPVMRVRGVVTAMDGAVLTVKGRDGDVTLTLADGWTVGGRRPATLDDIKPGLFLGVGATPMTGGILRAAEIFIFPPGTRPGEGHRGWDVLPEGTMTNATVTEAVGAVDGRTLKLTYPGGERTIFVPPEAVIAQSDTAERADVKSGVSVQAFAERQSDGSLRASRLTVNKDLAKAP